VVLARRGGLWIVVDSEPVEGDPEGRRVDAATGWREGVRSPPPFHLMFHPCFDADLGSRKIGWFRVVRPLLTARAVVALYQTSVPTTGSDLALLVVGVGAGVLVGVPSHLFMLVRVDPRGCRSGLAFCVLR
jgi:hypothetical protein